MFIAGARGLTEYVAKMRVKTIQNNFFKLSLLDPTPRTAPKISSSCGISLYRQFFNMIMAQ
jgi:hypothetical protein